VQLTRAFKQFLLLFAMAFIPLMGLASVEPATECPKKKKEKGDSLEVLEKKVDIPMTEISQQPITGAKSIDKTSEIKYTGEPMSEMDNEDPNSALSFNFVYYIFEKFKFSSAVEPQ
jgi:hypothetical protein